MNEKSYFFVEHKSLKDSLRPEQLVWIYETKEPCIIIHSLLKREKFTDITQKIFENEQKLLGEKNGS